MRGKKIAALLAAMALFGAAPVASARHMAEEYVDRVQRERQERLQEEARMRRVQEQAEARRRAQEARQLHDDEDEEDTEAYDEEIDEEDARDDAHAAEEAARQASAAEKIEERRQEDNFRKEEALSKEEARRRKEERREAEKLEKKRAKEEAALEKERRKAEEKERRRAEKEEREREKQAAKEKERAEKEARRAAEAEEASKEAANTGEGILEKYLRRAREKVQGSVPASASTEARLHIAKEQPIKRLEVETVDTGGTLLFSDSPEYVKEPGILYTDVVKGDARVFYYHLNDTKKPYKVAVVLESVGGQYAVVRVTRRAVAAPSENYFEVGKGLQEAYFADNQATEKMYIGPDDRRLLLEEMDKTIVKPGELVSGMVDFSVTAPVRVSVLFYPTGKDPLKYVVEADVLPADEHRLRGTFVGMDRILRLKHSYRPDDDGLACIILADGERDAYREGVDATDGSLATNSGNYGMLYRLELPVRGKTRFLMSPMGGLYAGVVRAESERSGSQLISVPSRSFFFGESTVHPPFTKEGMSTLLTTADIADLGVFPAKPRTFFDFSPPGASNLPVMLILAPENTKLTEEPEKTP